MTRIKRIVWLFATLALAGSALVLSPSAQAGQEQPEYPYCGERTLADCENLPGYGTPAQVEGVHAILPLRDTLEARSLYYKLIGPRFEMPDTPMVRVIFNDIRLGHAVPVVQDMGPTRYDSRYLEFGLQLLVRYGPHIGWRDVRLVLNDRAGFELGRAGATPKFLADMVYEQDPREIAGYATARVDGAFVMRADWEIAPDLELDVDYVEPTNFRMSDNTEDGDSWNGRVGHGGFSTLPGVPVEWITGVDLPVANPTAATYPATAVRVRVRLTADWNQFDDPPAERRSWFDPKPLPAMFADGEHLGVLVDLDQEVPGVQYGPSHGILLAEGSNVTNDGPCAERANCEGGTYRDEATAPPGEGPPDDDPRTPPGRPDQPGRSDPPGRRG